MYSHREVGDWLAQSGFELPRAVALETFQLLGNDSRLRRAARHEPAQLAITWVRTKRPNFMPTLGCHTRRQLDESCPR